MKITKEVKDVLRKEYEKEWQTAKMVDYCTNKAAAIALLDDCAIVPIERQSIKKHFCYGEDGGESYKAAQADAHRARNDEDYFRRENMEHFNSWIRDLKEQRDFFKGDREDAPHWITLIGKHKTSRMAYLHNESLRSIIGYMGGSCFVRELPGQIIDIYGTPYRVPSLDELERIIQACEEAAELHEKRVNTYLKKYGLSKVRSWTYWTMAEDAAPYQAEGEKALRRITTSFVLDAPFFVDIVENQDDKTWEAWLYDDTCSYKMLMFGAGNPDGKSAPDIFEEYADTFSGYQDIYCEDLRALEEAAEERFYR